ncbi:gamma-glutamyl-gamma-aminobutyrate hydrolase family protein [soil metagenome]
MLPRIGITSSPFISDGPPLETLTRGYVDAVLGAGGLPIIIPILEPGLADEVLDTIDGLIMSGGGDVDPKRYGQEAVPEVDGVHEARDEWELALIPAALRRDLPVLGICRGTQVINVACGGTLVQDLPSVSEHVHRDADRSYEIVHAVEIDARSNLSHVVDATRIGERAFGANTLHHQAVDKPGTGLRIVAWAEDRNVEGIESTDGHPLIGVQWHPELLTNHAPHRALFSWLVGEAGEARRRRQVVGEALAAKLSVA